jgi:hypothetical protein
MIRAFPQSIDALKTTWHNNSDSEKSEKNPMTLSSKRHVAGKKSFIRKKPAISLSLQHE